MNLPPHIKFVVNETPYCFWGINQAEQNLNFLNSIDTGYFQHVAGIHKEFLEGDQKQYAAVALRVAYSHALETMFSLLCAIAQSHDCIVGWMIKYRNPELEKVIKKIHNAQIIKTKLNTEVVTWRILAECVFQRLSSGDQNFDLQTRAAFAELWEKFAFDYLDPLHGIEYNNIKHGLRVELGGIVFGISKEPDVLAENLTADDFLMASNSTFGSTFLIPEKLHDSQNFTIKQQSVNWAPQKFVQALRLISMSIQNIIAWLKAFYGADITTLKYSFCDDLNEYNELWQHDDSFKLGQNSKIKEFHITPLSKEDIIAAYDKSNETRE